MTEHLPLILATFLLAGMVKGVVGLGLPTIAVGLLGLHHYALLLRMAARRIADRPTGKQLVELWLCLCGLPDDRPFARRRLNVLSTRIG